MTDCAVDIVLYFYDEMEPAERVQAAAHVEQCAACRQRLDELDAIRRALASRPAVDAPAAGDWSGFMRRLDSAVAPAARRPAAPVVLRQASWPVRSIAALAAMVALVTIGVTIASRYNAASPAERAPIAVAAAPAAPDTAASSVHDAQQSLRAGSAEHLERSKLVVLGLATRDPHQTSAADWQYERQLAGTLLSDTRLYRLAAQDRGVSDVARVMRDLETVFLEASLSDSTDKDALERVQRLIAKRDLVLKMQVVAGTAGL
jgi:hypothetical protein